ncbi:MAG: urea carboxylase [Gammaproteobacteria bacterium]|nr:urea carboxylase [Gammaproteobacteria bacterium]
MFNKVLIANRGAIATRIIRTLKQMGITSVAVYAEADADSLHVLQADEAYALGEGRAADTYLNQDKLFEIIKQSGAEAVHPGYGFLSENAEFVRRCEAEGIAYVGPTAEQIETFGLKHTARSLAQQSDVPLLPGTELLDSLDEAVSAADEIGYPVMLKSTAGGGGIGMQLCYDEKTLRGAYESVRRLGENNFSNSGVFLEKFIERARHIEVQIFGDGQGKAIALGERDCSTQRRNQKVIEECPAPGLSDAVRNELQDTATRLVAAIDYRNAGTVEFVYDQKEDKFYFLEVNTRLQVEHGVTEQVYGIDLVAWMVRLAAHDLPDLNSLASQLSPTGHAIQTRVYAEDPNKDFQPSAGLLSQVEFPQGDAIRVDHWIEGGIEVSPFYDPMLAKLIITARNRDEAMRALHEALGETRIYGVETNIEYVRHILETEIFQQGEIYTRYLNDFSYEANSIDVINAGTMTTIQDTPGRIGYWDVGVPPSGPFDSYSFRLGNRLLNNPDDAAGLELTLNGPTLRFNTEARIVLTGAEMTAKLDDEELAFWQVHTIRPGQVLKMGKMKQDGARTYLLIDGGIDCPDYLGARSTFTLGQFGGHNGRALRAGDVLHLGNPVHAYADEVIPEVLRPSLDSQWELRVTYGPHGAPDFFTDEDIENFFSAEWEVHYNSSRTGIRLIGPKPEWARDSGGEAGMHPSNIHDNAYAFGTVDFTGDMPVILGPDGPSLGGFVCPATVISADLWKLGQLKAGDKIRFTPVSMDDAVAIKRTQETSIATLSLQEYAYEAVTPDNAIHYQLGKEENEIEVVYRTAGDQFLLVEYGPMQLEVALRFRAHALMLSLQEQAIDGILELTPGIRSLQVHYDSQRLSLDELMSVLLANERELKDIDKLEVPARVVHLPLSWDDPACQLAIDKYMQSVRKDAPWCPSNIEFIRRINGLETIDEVNRILFEASYLVMGLGDVYLGAPVATPMDPRQRLVTTKYNPARTWTAENSVGIGGSYLCVYGMEGPGGYQFVGRTLQMWNRYRSTNEFTQPWLLRFFDQIRFYPVSHEELEQIRKDFPRGKYPLKIEETRFRLRDHVEFLREHEESIRDFTERRDQAFAEELQRWRESGQINFSTEQDLNVEQGEEGHVPDNCFTIESPVAGSIWQTLVSQGDRVEADQTLMILESMKMEIEITAPASGTIYSIQREVGGQVNAGQVLLILEEDDS